MHKHGSPTRLIRIADYKINGVDVENTVARSIPKGFDFSWYFHYSYRIPLYLLIGVAIYNLLDLIRLLWVLFLRWKDRKFSMNLDKDPDDPENDEPNSRMRMQSELVNMYIGSEFNL